MKGSITNMEYEEQEYETSLEEVMTFYAKGFEGMARYEFFINPVTHKVFFKLYVRKEVDTGTRES